MTLTNISFRFNRIDAALDVALQSGEDINDILDKMSAADYNPKGGLQDFVTKNFVTKNTISINTILKDQPLCLSKEQLQEFAKSLTAFVERDVKEEDREAYELAKSFANTKSPTGNFIKAIMQGKLKVVFPQEVSDWFRRIAPDWGTFRYNEYDEATPVWTLVHTLAYKAADRIVRNQHLATFIQLEGLQEDYEGYYAFALCCGGYYMYLMGYDLATFTTEYKGRESYILDGIVGAAGNATMSVWGDFAYHHRRSERKLDIRELIEFNEDNPATTAKRKQINPTKRDDGLKGGCGDGKPMFGKAGVAYNDTEPTVPCPTLDAIHGVHITGKGRTLFHNGKPMFGMLLDKAGLSPQEKSILSGIFLEGKTLRSIGENLGTNQVDILRKRNDAYEKIRAAITESDAELGLFVI